MTSGLLDDCRFTWRNLRSRVWANLASVILIAAALVVFVNAAALVKLIAGEQPATVPTPGLHAIGEGSNPHASILGSEVLALRNLDPTLERMVVFRQVAFNLADSGPAERLEGLQLDGDLFALLGWSMHLGGGFRSADFAPGAAPTAVISHRLWVTRYAADPTVVGRNVRVDGVPATIVGVLEKRREYPFQQQVYRNLSLRDQPELATRYWTTMLQINDPGDRERITGAVASVAAKRVQDSPEQTLRVLPLFGHSAQGESIIVAWTLQILAALLVLTAAANAGGLLWVQWLGRTGELATRAALGATPGRQLRLVVVQAAMIAGFALLLGMPASHMTMNLLEQYLLGSPSGMPAYFSLQVTPQTLLSVAIVMLAAVPVMALPALLRLRAMGINAGMRQGARAGTQNLSRTTRSFFAAQIAVSAITLTAVLVAVGGAQQALNRSMGFDESAIAVGSFSSMDVNAQQRFSQALLTRLREHPGVAAASASLVLPQDGEVATVREVADGERRARIGMFEVERDYLQVFQLNLLAGRWFTDADNAQEEYPVVVDRRVAQQWFAGDAVGRTLALSSGGENRRFTVVGVVDAQGRELAQGMIGAVYSPIRWRSGLLAWVSVRMHSSTATAALARELPAIARSIDPDIAVANAQTWNLHRWEFSQWTRLVLMLFAPLGVLALGLTALGAGALTGALIGMRARELALRRALGAAKLNLGRAAIGGLISFSLVGLIIGMGLGAVLGDQLANVLYRDANLLLSAVIVMPLALGLAMLVASLAPLTSALRVDPAAVLRNE